MDSLATFAYIVYINVLSLPVIVISVATGVVFRKTATLYLGPILSGVVIITLIRIVTREQGITTELSWINYLAIIPACAVWVAVGWFGREIVLAWRRAP